MNVAYSVLWRMAIILKANKVNLFVSSVLFVFWYYSPKFLDTPHILQGLSGLNPKWTACAVNRVVWMDLNTGLHVWLSTTQEKCTVHRNDYSVFWASTHYSPLEAVQQQTTVCQKLGS
jgi:hypothetical protein